jgi:hypothetical protein
MLLAVQDESATGQSLHELALDFLSDRITVRDLIRERVHHEATEFNRQRKPVFQGLVRPVDTERILNHRPVDWEEQFARALDGFSKNAFFIVIDDRQAESLDQEFVIGPATKVSFVKLIPLIGG